MHLRESCNALARGTGRLTFYGSRRSLSANLATHCMSLRPTTPRKRPRCSYARLIVNALPRRGVASSADALFLAEPTCENPIPLQAARPVEARGANDLLPPLPF